MSVTNQTSNTTVPLICGLLSEVSVTRVNSRQGVDHPPPDMNSSLNPHHSAPVTPLTLSHHGGVLPSHVITRRVQSDSL